MRAERLINLIMILRSKGRMTAQALAAALEVSERTIYRDLESLSLVGIPVYTQAGVGGGIGLDEEYRISVSGFSMRDIQALFIPHLTSAVHDLGLTPDQSLLKLMATLMPQQRDEVRRMHQRLYIDNVNWFQSTEGTDKLALLQNAIWQDLLVELDYQPIDGESSTRILEPYGIVAKANLWYLVACRPELGWRIYRVGRILSLKVLDKSFQRDEGFDLGSFWRESARVFEQAAQEALPPLDARLRLHQTDFWIFPAYLEGLYKVIQRDAEGWIILDVRFPDSTEAHARLLSLGGAVQILEPTSLREAVLNRARATLEAHQGM